jgi:hypothetical protein
MPGGKISISIDEDFGIVMVGPVARIAEGQLADEIFGRWGQVLNYKI